PSSTTGRRPAARPTGWWWSARTCRSRRGSGSGSMTCATFSYRMVVVRKNLVMTALAWDLQTWWALLLPEAPGAEAPGAAAGVQDVRERLRAAPLSGRADGAAASPGFRKRPARAIRTPLGGHYAPAKAIRQLQDRVHGGFRRVLLRGDTDFSQTEHLDRWDAD